MADNSAASTSGLRESKSSDRNNGDRNKDRNSRGRGRGGGGRGFGRGRGGGGRGGAGSKERGGKRQKDMGRGEWNRTDIDKRKRNQEAQDAKKRKAEEDGVVQDSPFTAEEIAAETRKPKHKVAVMIGYAGSGYKGMQINALEKTIEGDLFKAFVAAGAISKANADDPKKSSLVRCARTDKGVHAAGNVISLKLIVEEPNIVQAINENLPPQIRVWGIERTNGAFSCYQTCDSRWYEYLIPTFSFLPPHPSSFLGKELVKSAEQEGIFETYQSLQQDIATFWADTDEKYVKPILERLDPELRKNVEAIIYESSEDIEGAKAEDNAPPVEALKPEPTETIIEEAEEPTDHAEATAPTALKRSRSPEDEGPPQKKQAVEAKEPATDHRGEIPASSFSPLEQAVRDIKAAYVTAKKAYRISDVRRARVQEALNCYLGTCNFHNYTIQKSFSDPSARRVIRSFKVGPEPVIINDTEWLSLKVHGQSFMMHQIRKMVAMVALVVRCGSKTDIIKESYGPANISIPKAPGLGLLLERPVFDSYNEKAVKEYNREKLDFDKYQKEMDEFKQREIYDRIFREEERDHQYHTFFHHIDNYKTDFFLWVTAGGIGAARQSKAPARTDDNSDDEADANGQEG